MSSRHILDRRLRSHRLVNPARTLHDAASHMLAVQAQEFWGGRWALAVRTAGAPSATEVDARFDAGELVRAWTMRGTLHIVPAQDLGWMLSVTGERQLRMAAARHRELGLDEEHFARAEAVVRARLRGGGRLTRAEFTGVLAAAGVDPQGQRGIHVLQVLALRGVIVWGPVVARVGGPTREQYLVLTEEWVTGSVRPEDPLRELFARFATSHGPVDVRDFAWWAGLPLGQARKGALAASDALAPWSDAPDPAWVVREPAPRRSARVPPVHALAPFDEYYISYTDRTVVCPPEYLGRVGPGRNGMVRPVLVAGGRVVGVWTHSRATGRHDDRPRAELFVPGAVRDDDVAAALDRYASFVTG